MHPYRNLLWLFVFVPVFVSCGFLEELAKEAEKGAEKIKKAEKPQLSHKKTALTKSPSVETLAAYFCPQLLDKDSCSAVFDRVPAKKELRFDLELTFEVKNPNEIPIPTVSMLLALDVFKGESAQKLGAACVTFCKKDDPSCTGKSASGTCQKGTQKNITSWEDVAEAAVKGLLGLALNEPAYKENHLARMIPAKGSADLKIVFTLGLDPMLVILEKVIEKYVDALIDGKETELLIPYSLRGTIWVDLPYEAGRFGVSFGPLDSTWKL